MLRYRLVLNLSFCLLTLAVARAQVRAPLAPRASTRPLPDYRPPSETFSLGPAPKTSFGPVNDNVRDTPSPQGLLRVAAQRTVSSSQMNQGVWQQTSGGAVWRLSIQAQNAVGIRVHFTNFSIGSGQVWVHDTSNPAVKVFGPYTGNGRNNGDFWSGIVFGDTVEIEYQPAAGRPTSGQPPFQISEISQLWRFGRAVAPRQSPQLQAPEASSGSGSNTQCFLDASCYSNPASGNYNAAVGNAVRSTAVIVFSNPSGTYLCTATLLNAPNGSPLLLTAGHCISNQVDAESMIAVFNAVDQTCQQPPFSTPGYYQLNALPQANGRQLLSVANQPFISGSDQTQVNDDLDYALVLLDDFPGWPNAALSGYTAKPVTDGQQLVSVSAPRGMFLKAAFSTVVGGPWANGFEVDQTAQGRIDSGSSGSALFDGNGALVGVLSTATLACSPDSQTCNATACDVNGEFRATYTAFSAIYPLIRTYLNQPISNTETAVVESSGLISASPITNINSLGFGDTTLTMNAPAGVKQTEIHVGAPNGPLFYFGDGHGTATASGWVKDGNVFYFQDISVGRNPGLGSTLGTAIAHMAAATFTATPPVILFPDALGNGSITLNWNDPDAKLLEVHVHSPSGPLLTFQGGPSGSVRAEGWVSDGMVFVLCDVSNGPCSSQNTVATLTAHVASDSMSTVGSGGGSAFVASPNPVPVYSPGAPAYTVLYFDVPGANTLQIHIGSPTGPLFTQTGASGIIGTGYWLTDGMTFYLQDVSNGLPGITVATTTVHLTSWF